MGAKANRAATAARKGGNVQGAHGERFPSAIGSRSEVESPLLRRGGSELIGRDTDLTFRETGKGGPLPVFPNLHIKFPRCVSVGLIQLW